MRRAAPWIVLCLILTLFSSLLLSVIRHQVDESDAERMRAAREFAAFKARSSDLDKQHFDLFVEYVRANQELMKENRGLADEILNHPKREFRDF